MSKNVEKSKILLSFVVITLIFVLLGNVYSLATEGNTNNTVTITATTENTAAQGNNTANTNTNTNSSVNITSVVSSNSNNATNNTNNNTTNNTANNTSTYNNSNTNRSGLPYTGTNSNTILLVVVFAISAVYAYKKVSDYNI